MIIDRVELRIVKIPLTSPFKTSGWKETNKAAILVELRGDGEVGYGECVATEGPWYSYETVGTAWHTLSEFIIPIILKMEIHSIEQFGEALARIRGHNMAKASVEMALWDLQARALRLPLSRLLGGIREKVASGVSIGIQESVEALLDIIRQFLDDGYQRIKIKVKPGWDVNVVRRVRESYPQVPLMVDANAAYTLKDTETLLQLDKFNLMMVEQPLDYDDLVDHAALQSRMKTPLCLDESIKSPEDARRALALGSCRVVNIKPGRVGGHLNSKRIHDHCLVRGVPVWCGGMLETGIGRAHNVALASLPNFTLPNDISASRRYFETDIIEPPFELNSDGTLTVPQRDGIGVEVVKERLDRYTVKRQSYSKL